MTRLRNALALLSLLSACASHPHAVTAPAATTPPPPPPRPSATATAARLEDVFTLKPDLLAVVRPRSVREDRVYGPLFRQAIRLARQQSKVVAATRLAESLEDADEVVLGLSNDPREVVLVENGVRADIDPAKLVDDEGVPLFRPGPTGPPRELVHHRQARKGEAEDAADDEGMSLFELPGRTWVIASGSAAGRARDVLAVHPGGFQPLGYGERSLAFVRIDGPALVSHVSQLRGKGMLAPVGHDLVSALLSLPPGATHALEVTLQYGTDEATLEAESTLKDTFGALGRSHSAMFSWLGEAKVEHTSRSVVVTAPLPPTLTDALLGAGG